MLAAPAVFSTIRRISLAFWDVLKAWVKLIAYRSCPSSYSTCKPPPAHKKTDTDLTWSYGRPDTIVGKARQIRQIASIKI